MQGHSRKQSEEQKLGACACPQTEIYCVFMEAGGGGPKICKLVTRKAGGVLLSRSKGLKARGADGVNACPKPGEEVRWPP